MMKDDLISSMMFYCQVIQKTLKIELKEALGDKTSIPELLRLLLKI